ncbi:alpha/beta-hydrolase N-terminal domain-containing protein, partial [Nocardia sp. JMUB6875]|uniref:alpha/beta-hydrolase N-terminal domain-containing protein n=1 Tax=Nocardia sp. JMUB6875 TaxID=3158170 RepID=UPI0034E8C433
MVSLAPGLLPRTPSAQGILTALVVLIALGLAGLVRMVVRLTRFGVTRLPYARVTTAIVAVGLCGAAMGYAEQWQSQLRGAMGVAGIGPSCWAQWLAWTVPLGGAAVAIARGMRAVVGGWGRGRSVAAGA